jgi:hypothetical protein
MKGFSKGGWYKCSSTCEFIYFIYICGGAIVTGKCPECKYPIGGSRYKAIEREGHINMIDDEAREYLIEKINTYERESQRGY